ncbi:pentapeptide repeat-containing protein [Methylobacterium soli]|uniref:Pentapeptide repeat-containing protein n=1 Tax=Methylobacterium soli TaxID=553447 RepID=A0A6L3T0L2_9HYPH|nr:pentapeptide repeat-containing protein [Methylobacterium soli]
MRFAAAATALAAAWGPVPGPARAAPRAGPAECRAAASRTDSLDRLGPRGEIALASGARVLLGSLHWPEDPAAAASAAAWLDRHRGRSLTVTARGEPDRWGRSRIDAILDPEDAGGEPTDLAGGLIRAGLAQVDAGEGDVLCRPGLLALEEGARRAGLGLWGAPGPGAQDGAALRAAAGRFVVARGRIVGVGERSARTYLDFVRRGEDGLTVIVSKRTWRRLQEHGLSAAGLKGRVVRVRGIIEIGRGPVMDVASAEMIEVLGDDDERGEDPQAGPERERALRR